MRKIIFLNEAHYMKDVHSREDQKYGRKIRKACAKYVLRDSKSQSILKNIKKLYEELALKNDLKASKKVEYKRAKKEKDVAKKSEIKRELIDILKDRWRIKNEISKLKKELQAHLDAVDALPREYYTIDKLISDFLNDRLRYLAEF